MMTSDTPPPTASHRSRLSACGAVCAGLAVALAAYAAHAAAGPAQGLLQMAAAVLFGHGVALAALARGASGRLRRLALAGLLAGSVLFAGSVVLHVLAGVAAHLAPAGGMLTIGSWLLLAADLWRE